MDMNWRAFAIRLSQRIATQSTIFKLEFFYSIGISFISSQSLWQPMPRLSSLLHQSLSSDNVPPAYPDLFLPDQPVHYVASPY
jgi:hypothetical protein